MNAMLLLRWSARLLSVALATMFAVFAIGEGPPPVFPPSLHSLSFALLAMCLAGLLLAWRYEVVGAVLALVGGVGFYLNDFSLSNLRSLPSGWVFPMLIVTPLLYVAAAVLDHRHQAPRPA